MSLFAQLYNAYNAVTGSATDTANDNGLARSHDDELPLPPNPVTPQHSSTSETVDLTSPTEEAPPQRGQVRPDHDLRLPTPTPKNKISQDELRLVGDYDTPADAVYAPDPSSYFQTPRVMVKPGSTQAFKPINNLDGANHEFTSKKPVDYSKAARVGYALGPGQQKYEQMKKTRAPQTPARNVLAHQDQSYDSRGASPTKRRKTENARSLPAYVDITGDEDASQEVQEVQSPFNSTNPVVRRTGAPLSPRSVRSQRSFDGGPLSGKELRHQDLSAARSVNDMVRAARASKGPSRHDGQHRRSFGRSVSGSATPKTQIAPIDVEDYRPAPARPTSIFDNFQQGRVETSSHEDGNESSRSPVTSHQFPNARINEETGDSKRQTASTSRHNGFQCDLRTHRRAKTTIAETDPIEDDEEDELQKDMFSTKRTSTKRSASPSKARHAANKSAKRKSRSDKDNPSWPLLSARGHGWQALTTVAPQGNLPFITLEKDIEEPSIWCIMQSEREGAASVQKGLILPKDVTKVQCDHGRYMRLEGPRQSNGHVSIVDLEFQNKGDFCDFRDAYVAHMVPPSRLILKDATTMRTLFYLDLPKRNKTATSPGIEDSATADQEAHASAPWQSRSLMLNQDIAGPENSRNQAASNGPRSAASIFGSSRTQTRPARAKRSSAPVHDLEEVVERETVEKYSICHGLGPKWVRPLTYVSDLQRAVVNFDDLPRLDDEEMLNDSLIDFYMIYLFEKYNVPKDKVYFFNTYFYTKLTEKTGRSSMNYKAVQRWTHKIDIFGFDYIVVPIHEGIHWYLAIICNVDKIKRKLLGSDEEIAETPSKGQPESIAQLTSDAEKPETQQPLEASIPEEGAQGRDDEDANLFDEESISLVNPDDVGPRTKDGAIAEASPGPESSYADGQTVQAPCAASEPKAVPTIVLAEPKPAKESKKKSKRKPPVIKRDPSEPVIIILDSLTGGHSGTVRSLKDWLAAEGVERRGMEVVIKENGVYPKGEQIPTQNNFSDCGVYVLGYVEKFFQDPDEFKRKLLTGEMTTEDDWPLMKVDEMRNNLRDLLLALGEQQELTKPLKPKKKNPGAATNKVPTPPGSQPVNTTAVSRSSPAKQAEPTKVADSQAETAKPSLTESPSTVPDQELINGLPGPRLGSPFCPQPRQEPIAPREQSPEITVGKVSDSPPVSMSPPKRVTASPQKQSPGGWRSPQVRIPTKTPNSTQFIQSREVSTGATRVNGAQVQPKRDLSTSPVKKRRQAFYDKYEEPPVWDAESLKSAKRTRNEVNGVDDLGTRSANKRAQSASAEKGGAASRTGASLHRQLDGCSEQPIEIEDSQDVKTIALKSPRGFMAGAPAQRRQPSRSRHDVQSLRREPSIEEISPFAPRASPRKQHREAESHAIDAALVAEPDAEDRALSMERSESDTDAMDVDSRGGDPMNTAEDPDIEVPETPEAERMSLTLVM